MDANGSADRSVLTIPSAASGAKRPITIDDINALRTVDALAISPDGQHFAIFVHQGDPTTNSFRTGWFVGGVKGSRLVHVGDGGELQVDEELQSPPSQWSPDGQWIAYARRKDDQVQLWRSRMDGGIQEQVTHNPADVLAFTWNSTGDALIFAVGPARAERQAREEALARRGYSYDEDLNAFTDLMRPDLAQSLQSSAGQGSSSVWVVRLGDGHERIATDGERAEFDRAFLRRKAGSETVTGFYDDVEISHLTNKSGAQVWLDRVRPSSRHLRVMAKLSRGRTEPIACLAEACSGVIERVWWSSDDKRVLFWRHEGLNERVHAFYAWSPLTGEVSTIARATDADLRLCDHAAGDRLLCVRETALLPAHVVAINVRSGAVETIGDVNPEFHAIELGRVERFEWDTPRLEWNEPGGELAGLYPRRAYGYIFYPRNFDATKKYPVFIDPYVANGFARAGAEHPLHVYAEEGFVVLNTEFPFMNTDVAERFGAAVVKDTYSPKLGFPHMTMLMESTVRGLDTAAKRGFIDTQRVGIGGVSHGTFIPLYMMQRYDRIAAISISSPHWGQFQYYWLTRRGRDAVSASYGKVGYDDFIPKPEGAGREFWRGIDVADHVDAIEAPILMQLADRETFGLLRLIRNLSDAGKPYDAYVFPDEAHIKWQPAHLNTIMTRNLDWFRFWLQDREDSDPAKAEQYLRWHKLRELQNASSGQGEGVSQRSSGN
jgi:dipeptidyl aminopeptidase/acylaminoacyl peptidase